MAVEERHTAEPVPEIPRIGRMPLMYAVRRSIPIVLITVLLFVAAAVALGLLRDPVYTSEARLNVGGLNLTQQSIQGYTTAVGSLAVAYARAVHATAVVRPVARETGLPADQIRDETSATPIQGSPVIRVRGTSTNPDEAELLANTTAQSLVNYAIDLNDGDEKSEALRRRFLTASKRMREAHARSQRLQPNDPEWQAAQTRLDVARLEMQTAGTLFQQSQAGKATTNLVQLLAPAAPATSDRQEVLQQLVAAGLIAGLLVGLGLAVARTNRMTTRRLGEL
jgi:uncharacterized protein involved in exopolysaccharide biosynthesis